MNFQNNLELASIIEFYDQALTKSSDHEQVGWTDQARQDRELHVLHEAINRKDEPVSLLDVGCGLGRLYGFLEESGRKVEYSGIDIHPRMIEQACQNYPKGHFELKNILEESDVELRYDVVVCSGTLNVRTQNHLTFVEKMIEGMFERCSLVTAVNFQSISAFERQPECVSDQKIYFADPREIYELCRRYTPWITIREDYLFSDFTVYLYKKYPGVLTRHQEDLPDARLRPETAGLMIERGLYDEALEFLQKLPESSRSKNLEGVALLYLKQLIHAEQAFMRALELDPDSIHALQNLTGCYIRNYQLPDALALLQKAAIRHPDSVELRERTHNLLVLMKRYDEAIKVFKDSDDCEIRAKNLGICYCKMADWPEAVRWLLIACDLNLADSESRLWLSRAFRGCEQISNALEALFKAAECGADTYEVKAEVIAIVRVAKRGTISRWVGLKKWVREQKPQSEILKALIGQILTM